MQTLHSWRLSSAMKDFCLCVCLRCIRAVTKNKKKGWCRVLMSSSLFAKTTVPHYHCLNALEQGCIWRFFLFFLFCQKSRQIQPAVCMRHLCALMFRFTINSNVSFCLNTLYYVPSIMLINDFGDDPHRCLRSSY